MVTLESQSRHPLNEWLVLTCYVMCYIISPSMNLFNFCPVVLELLFDFLDIFSDIRFFGCVNREKSLHTISKILLFLFSLSSSLSFLFRGLFLLSMATKCYDFLDWANENPSHKKFAEHSLSILLYLFFCA